MKIKVVIRVTMSDPKKSRTKAMKIAATVSGVESVAIKGDDKDQIEVTGEGIDTVELAQLLRKKVGYADLLTVGPAKDEKEKEKEKEEEKNNITVEATGMPMVWSSHYPTTYYYRGDVPADQLYHGDINPCCSIM